MAKMETQVLILAACQVVCHSVLLSLKIFFYKTVYDMSHDYYKAQWIENVDRGIQIFFLNYKSNTHSKEKTWRATKDGGKHQRSVHNFTNQGQQIVF